MLRTCHVPYDCLARQFLMAYLVEFVSLPALSVLHSLFGNLPWRFEMGLRLFFCMEVWH